VENSGEMLGEREQARVINEGFVSQSWFPVHGPRESAGSQPQNGPAMHLIWILQGGWSTFWLLQVRPPCLWLLQGRQSVGHPLTGSYRVGHLFIGSNRVG